jgi:type IV secretory pathway VirB9-like protein
MADTKIIVNCETGETLEVELTAEEVAQREAEAAAYLEQKAADEKAAADKEAARQAVYAKLGLTPDEVAALLG